jgi:hypothetical protein
VLLCNTFMDFLVVRLIDNCCKSVNQTIKSIESGSPS